MTTTHRRGILKLTVLAGTVGLFRQLNASDDRMHRVVISQFEYSPGVLDVRAGDVIIWVNDDIVPHTATAEDLSWDTGEIVSGDSKSLMVTEGFSANYFCRYHPMMKASVSLIDEE